MRFKYLNDWLNWQESLNPTEIDLGLDRISAVLKQASLSSTFNCPLITVAGTNGKGSVVAMLEAIAIKAGLKVCSYTSPHIFHYNERIKIDGKSIKDNILCEAFERIDQARGDLSLTYFEFGTLAAIDLFFKQQPELVILEVGLGGRLDAVNIMEPDVSVLTSVAIDHTDWLGDDRESIGYEKAGIFRAGRPVICGERLTPESVIKQAEKLHCEFVQLGRDYEIIKKEEPAKHWKLQSCYTNIEDLPEPSLAGEFQKSNAATAIVAMQALHKQGLLTQDKKQLINAVSAALPCIDLPGRFQLIQSKPQVYVDVAHNPQAAKALFSQLQSTHLSEYNTWAIVAMLSDKDINGVLENVSGEVDCWCFAGLENASRGLSVQALVKNLPENFNIDESNTETIKKNQCKMPFHTTLLAQTVEKACEMVLSKANKNDRIIIFGSFYTVAQAMQYFSQLKTDVVESIN